MGVVLRIHCTTGDRAGLRSAVAVLRRRSIDPADTDPADTGSAATAGSPAVVLGRTRAGRRAGVGTC
ncbi:hypothetical protein GCM10009665_55160 [Kitasatospora nipponensis]|uniref:ACT domain-containing protein n=1 Tax=Kitasatospora nipponensis TaxID=258049 RepID=A0ABN1WS97_9ACTN